MIELDKIAHDVKEAQKNIEKRIVICAGTGCVANGSLKVFDSFRKTAKELGIAVSVELKEENKKTNLLTKSGCQGFCQMGPLVNILPDGILYNKVKPEDVREILEASVKDEKVVERLSYHFGDKICKGQSEIPFYTKQHRAVLKQCGVIDPENIDEYISDGGYQAAKKACIEMTDKDI
ncbi:MAG: NAD(P)H-dependent oxidoreductase subunit E, partial [Endomicrobium sp.]|nr:NAD(P)H-dependent oxidoreductase subunit E [Endomicrobium sp.]